jgi:hypothetical protein
MNYQEQNNQQFDSARYLFTKEVLVGNNSNEAWLSYFKDKSKDHYNNYLLRHNISINKLTDMIYDIIKIPYKFNEIYGQLYRTNIYELIEFNKIVLKIFCIENDKEEQLENDMNNIEDLIKGL